MVTEKEGKKGGRKLKRKRREEGERPSYSDSGKSCLVKQQDSGFYFGGGKPHKILIGNLNSDDAQKAYEWL